MINQKIVVIGGGESGCGAALLAKQKGYDVFVSDKNVISKKYKKILKKNSIRWEECGHNIHEFKNANEVVKSPGINEQSLIIKELRQLDIKIISEIDFALRFTKSKIIAVTGSNGKTTTTKLIEYIFKKAKYRVKSVGNIGTGFCMQLFKKEYEYYILELSSFQLRDSSFLKPYISIILNITKDHIEDHGSFDNYIKSKLRIFQNQDNTNHFVFNSEDDVISNIIDKNKIKPNKYSFSSKNECHRNNHSFFGKSKIKLLTNQNQLTMNINQLALQGKHNIYNSMAASIAAKIMNIENNIIRESLRDFKNLEHRLENFIKVYGIDFINDSKATNVNSTWYALESINKPIVWIAGGIDKGNDYEILKDLTNRKVKALICLGKDNTKLKTEFKKHIKIIHECNSMKSAVEMSFQLASFGDAVLLSPACASFDLYNNFEDRGNDFKREVKNA